MCLSFRSTRWQPIIKVCWGWGAESAHEVPTNHKSMWGWGAESAHEVPTNHKSMWGWGGQNLPTAYVRGLFAANRARTIGSYFK